MTRKVLPPKRETVKLAVDRESLTSNPILPGEIKGVTSNLVTVHAEVGVDVSSTISQHPVYFLVGGRGTFTMDAVSRAVNRLTLFVAKPGAPRDPENLHP